MSITIDEINNFEAEIKRLKEKNFEVETNYALKCARVEFLEELVRRIGKEIDLIIKIEGAGFDEGLRKEFELIQSMVREIEQ